MERTPYFQKLMDCTYPSVAIEAIKNGFDGAWERLIAKELRLDYEHEKEAEILLESCFTDTDDFGSASLKAAKLITSSTIPQPHEH